MPHEAYLDSLRGLIPCLVVGVDEREVTVDFPEGADALHWSGMTSNPWAGFRGEKFRHHRVVPKTAVKEVGGMLVITPYTWSTS